MRCPARLLAVYALFCVAVAGGAEPSKVDIARPDAETAEGARTRFEGTWHLTSLMKDGKERAKADLEGYTLIFSGDRYTYKGKGGERDEGTFAIDTSKEPAVMRTTKAGGPDRGTTMLRIYTWVDDDTVKFCSPAAGEERPTKFDASQGSGRELSIWTREKD